jgi:putative beta-lysine N-acetyltransferase
MGNDVIQDFHGARIQHGPESDRIYLMDLGVSDTVELAPQLVELAKRFDYGKIFAKIRAKDAAPFLDARFSVEANAQRMCKGEEEVLFLGLFLDEARKHESLEAKYDEVLDIALSKQHGDGLAPADGIRLCTASDAPAMAQLYDKVFDSYPFPIHDPQFIAESMKEGTVYAAMENEGRFVALASAECEFHQDKLYAEMTDFATLPSERGKGHASTLLSFLEGTIAARGIKTAYTIARAISPGMNITFAKSAYSYGGRLKNNTQIAGRIESMNVWYKSIV